MGRWIGPVSSAIWLAALMAAQVEPLPARWVVGMEPRLAADPPWRQAVLASLELLGQEGRAGLVFANGLGAPLLPVSDRQHQRDLVEAFERTQKGDSRYSLQALLQDALHRLGPRDPSHQDHLWLLFDSAPTSDPDLPDLNSLLADAAIRGATVHLVSPRTLSEELRHAVRRTGGRQAPWQSSGPFWTLVQEGRAAVGTEVLGLDAGAMWVDDQVDALSVLMRRANDRANQLILPDAVELSSDRPGGARWWSSDGLEVARLTRPPYGAWRIDQGGDLDQAAPVVRSSRLKLGWSWEPAVPVVGAPVELRAALLEDGRRVVSYARLKHLSMTLRWTAGGSEGQDVVLQATGDGGFRGRFVPDREGDLWMTLVARSPELHRHAHRRLGVQRTCFTVTAEFGATDVEVKARLRGACSDLREVAVDAFAVTKEGRGPARRLQPDREGAWTLRFERPEGLRQIAFEGQALSPLGERRLPLPTLDAPVPDTGLPPWLGLLVAQFAPLVVAGLVWSIHRHLLEHEAELFLNSEGIDLEGEQSHA